MLSDLLNIILADDDEDDCFLFREALGELNVLSNLIIVHNGSELLQLLEKQKEHIWNVLFLDLNMPGKNGFACLAEIKLNKYSNYFPVAILSTSLENNIADQLYNDGASFYIRKPSVFAQLKNVILQVITLTADKNMLPPAREQFIIN